MLTLSWSLRTIFDRVSPLMELLSIPPDLCGTWKLNLGPKNALQFQSKLRQKKQSSKEMLQKNSHKLVCSTSITLEVEQHVMFSVALLLLWVLKAVLQCILMSVLEARLLLRDKQLIVQPKGLLLFGVNERSLTELLHSWSWFTYLKTFVVPASWILVLRLHYTFKAN